MCYNRIKVEKTDKFLHFLGGNYMFTKISKVVLWIGIVAGFVLSRVFGTSVKGWEFLVMLGGWIATLIIFSAFGMSVEKSENIRRSRELLETMSRNGAQTLSIPGSTSSSEASNGKASLLAASQASDYWKCPTCGYSNFGTRKYCEKCDTPKS